MKVVKILGGLGNQMFQYAFYLALQKKFNNTKVDTLSFTNYKLHNGFELDSIFNIKINQAPKILVKLFNPEYRAWSIRKLRRILGYKNVYFEEQNLFSYDESLLENKHIKYYFGYWQNERYFKNIKEEVLTAFEFKNPLQGDNAELARTIKTCESVSVHVRRGDYVDHDLLGGICDTQYYINAIDLIKSKVQNPHFIIFSNDIEWCKSELKLSNATFVNWNKGSNSYIDMQLMTLCKHNIIANSSFSWWGAYLNKNLSNIVIAPKKWTNNDKFIQNQICPKNWISI